MPPSCAHVQRRIAPRAAIRRQHVHDDIHMPCTARAMSSRFRKRAHAEGLDLFSLPVFSTAEHVEGVDERASRAARASTVVRSAEESVSPGPPGMLAFMASSKIGDHVPRVLPAQSRRRQQPTRTLHLIPCASVIRMISSAMPHAGERRSFLWHVVVMAGVAETRRLLGASLTHGDAARRQLSGEQRQVRRLHDERVTAH